METRHRLFASVAEAAVLLTVTSWALVFVTYAFIPNISSHKGIAAAIVVVLPDGLATAWVFRRVRIHRATNDARRAAVAFAASAPATLGIGTVLSVMVGGYAEGVLGSHFVLPAMVVFVTVLMIFVPNAVVMWALHPSGGIGPAGESGLNEHR